MSTNEKVREICSKYGFDIDPLMKIYDMSVSQKQTVEIVKVLYRGADILILDEPTAVLTPQETDKLFDVLRNMRADGKAIVIITHKLAEVMAISGIPKLLLLCFRLAMTLLVCEGLYAASDLADLLLASCSPEIRSNKTLRSLLDTTYKVLVIVLCVEFEREVVWNLPACGDNHAVGVLQLEDIHHALESQLVEIEAVAHVVVGGDGLRVVVNHHGAVSVLADSLERLHAAPVELHGGADTVSTRT